MDKVLYLAWRFNLGNQKDKLYNLCLEGTYSKFRTNRNVCIEKVWVRKQNVSDLKLGPEILNIEILLPAFIDVFFSDLYKLPNSLPTSTFLIVGEFLPFLRNENIFKL